MEWNRKGQICPYTLQLCQEGYCSGCQIYLERWIRAHMKGEIDQLAREIDVLLTVPDAFTKAFEEGEG